MAQDSSHPAAGTALITGASSGIGHEFALLFARSGYDLVLVARNRSVLDGLASQARDEFGVQAFVCPKDLSVQTAPEELFRELQQQGIAVDVLINDAGFAMQGPFVENELTTLLNMLQVNIVTLTHLTRLFLPPMIERGRGKVLNMASIGSYMPGPLMAAYFASKAYVLSFSEALSNEVEGTGVTITALCPGPTRTRFAARAKLTDTRAFRGTLMAAADVAQEGFEALMKGKTVVITGFKYRMQLLPTPLVPRRLLAHFARRYHETPSDQGVAAPSWATAPERSGSSHAAQP